MSVNTLAFLCPTMRMLADAQLTTWIFGGWAEELWQISTPRAHNDIDLLYSAHGFIELDRWSAATEGVIDIVGKRFSHKRAVIYQQIMIEFLLIERATDGFRTNFFEGLHILKLAAGHITIYNSCRRSHAQYSESSGTTVLQTASYRGATSLSDVYTATYQLAAICIYARNGNSPE